MLHVVHILSYIYKTQSMGRYQAFIHRGMAIFAILTQTHTLSQFQAFHKKFYVALLHNNNTTQNSDNAKLPDQKVKGGE